MRFAEPQWLIAGAVVVTLLFALRVRALRLTQRALQTLSSAHLLDAGALPSAFRRWLRVLVTCLAVAAAFVALARPQRGKEWQTLDRKGTDLLLVIDTSKSMNTDDVSPSRLERTKLAVRDLVARFPEDRVGLLAFAGDAYLESPMTLDHGALLETLSTFDSSIVPHPGTDIGRAIDSAITALKADSGSQKVIVLLTDGEDLRGQALDAAKRAAQAGIVIDTVGVGTPAGELVPATNDQGATIGVLRDQAGNPVRSRLDEPGLRAIAQAAHGTYRPLGADGGGLDRLYAESLAPMAHVEKGAKLRRVYAEWYALPLGLSLFGLALDALLGLRPRSRARRSERDRSSKPALAGAVAAATLLAFSPAPAHASIQSAEKAYRAGKFEDSAKEYAAELAKHPSDARVAVDAGAAAYRAGHFEIAEASLDKALKLADPKLQERVLYDLGDTRYRLGAATVKDAPEKTIERWKGAIDSYEGALRLSPTDADAKFNRDFVKRKLAELEQKQKNEPPRAKPPQPDQNGQANKGSQGNKGDKGDKGNRSEGSDKANQSESGKQPDDHGQGDGAKSGPRSSADQDQSDQDKKGKETGKAPGAKAGETGSNSQPAASRGSEGTSGTPQESSNQKTNAAPQTGPGQKDKPGDEQSGKEAAPRGLSARDARALLQALRGEERHVRFGNSSEQRSDDAPQKDW
jgi:Ca-activated chloride channel family protein